MRNEDYIVIQGWMLDLKLTEKQLRLYAIIWGYSRDGRSRMRATATHLGEWLKCTERTAKRLIYSLEDMGLVAHEVVTTANGRISEFWAIAPESAEAAPDGAKTKIKWAGKRARKSRGDRDTYVPTPSGHVCPDPSGHVCPDPIVDSNNILPVSHTKSNNKKSREDAPSSAAAFVPPTVEEVEEYAKAQGFADPAGFADYYVRYQTEAGWMTGKGSKRHQISNWKLNVVQWSQYRKNQIFSQPEPERAQRPAEPRRKRVVPVSDDEFATLFPGYKFKK